jgi:hypothetical protein
MLGLVPSIHAFLPSRGSEDVDPRDKPEDDGLFCGGAKFYSGGSTAAPSLRSSQ